MYELLKELLFKLGREALWVESGLKSCSGSLGPLADGVVGGGLCKTSRLFSSARLTENLPTRASGLVVTWKRPMVVVGLGEGHGEVYGEGWRDPSRVL